MLEAGARRGSRQTCPASNAEPFQARTVTWPILVGLVVGVNLASDPLLVLAGLVPFILAILASLVFTDTTPDDWAKLLAVNLVSAFACTHAALPAMQATGFGRVINIASEAARLGSKGGAVYAAAKGGVIAFTKSIARENARYGITANVIAPGPIRTPMLEQALAKGGDKILHAMTDATLLRRLGEPEEVAAAALFLASDQAAYITGETIGVSGGMGLGG